MILLTQHHIVELRDLGTRKLTLPGLVGYICAKYPGDTTNILS